MGLKVLRSGRRGAQDRAHGCLEDAGGSRALFSANLRLASAQNAAEERHLCLGFTLPAVQQRRLPCNCCHLFCYINGLHIGMCKQGHISNASCCGRMGPLPGGCCQKRSPRVLTWGNGSLHWFIDCRPSLALETATCPGSSPCAHPCFLNSQVRCADEQPGPRRATAVARGPI